MSHFYFEQGLLGWYMVKSGLEDRFHGESDVPRVSQYRLAAHLGSALVLYSLFFWSSLHHLLPAQTMQKTLALAKFKHMVNMSKAAVFITALSGWNTIALAIITLWLVF